MNTTVISSLRAAHFPTLKIAKTGAGATFPVAGPGAIEYFKAIGAALTGVSRYECGPALNAGVSLAARRQRYEANRGIQKSG